jgi:hypothetical protein
MRIEGYMTEEDTIRILRDRIPFYEMMKIYRSGIGPKYPRNSQAQWEEFFSKYGWNWAEFKTEWRAWNGGQDTYSDFEKSKR